MDHAVAAEGAATDGQRHYELHRRTQAHGAGKPSCSSASVRWNAAEACPWPLGTGQAGAGRSPAWSVEWYCHGWGTQVDVTEAIRSSRGGMVSFGIMGGKTITTYCSSRFSDRNMRPRLILGVAAQKKERKAAGQKATGEQ